MKNHRKFWEVWGKMIDNGFKEIDRPEITLLIEILPYLKKHHRLCEYSCNGEGVIRGKFYRCDNPEAYIDEDTTIFDKEIEKTEEKIITRVNGSPFRVAFQHDPRGYTTKVYYQGREIQHLLW